MRTIDHVALKGRDRAAIAAAVELLRRMFPVDRVVLFGSKATGKDDAESDIDLLVLTSRPLSWRERNAMTDALFDIQLDSGVVISTLAISSTDWNVGRYSVLPIHAEVERYGVAA